MGQHKKLDRQILKSFKNSSQSPTQKPNIMCTRLSMEIKYCRCFSTAFETRSIVMFGLVALRWMRGGPPQHCSAALDEALLNQLARHLSERLDFAVKASIAVSRPAVAGLGWYWHQLGSQTMESHPWQKNKKNAPDRRRPQRSNLFLCATTAQLLPKMSRSVDWQPRSVRGFMSSTLKKKQGLEVASKREGGKPRKYFIARGAK
jgi:hypothetical protein